MCDSHAALLVLTGSWLTSACQMLFAGNAVQVVPGRSRRGARAAAGRVPTRPASGRLRRGRAMAGLATATAAAHALAVSSPATAVRTERVLLRGVTNVSSVPGAAVLVRRMGSLRPVRVVVVGAGFAGAGGCHRAGRRRSRGDRPGGARPRRRPGLVGAVRRDGGRARAPSSSSRGTSRCAGTPRGSAWSSRRPACRYYVREQRGVVGVTPADLAAAAPTVAAAAARGTGRMVGPPAARLGGPAGRPARGGLASGSRWPVRSPPTCSPPISPAGRGRRLRAAAVLPRRRRQPAARDRAGRPAGRRRGWPAAAVGPGPCDRVVGREVAGAPDAEETRVSVRTDAGEVDADAVVVTVPFTVLDRIVFEPALPDWKRSALDRLGCGQAAKLHVRLAQPVDSARRHVGAGPVLVLGRVRRVGTPARSCRCFTGSVPALADLAVDVGPERWLRRLAAVAPELSLAADAEALLCTWQDDEWARARVLGAPGRSTAGRRGAGPAGRSAALAPASTPRATRPG